MAERILFSRETVVDALNDILKAIDLPENATRIKEAQHTAGNDATKRMRDVFPLVMLVQIDVIEKYGFSGLKGLTQFSKLVQGLGQEDSEVRLLNNKVRAYYLPDIPPFPFPPFPPKI